MAASTILCGVPVAVVSVRRARVGWKKVRAHPSLHGSTFICRCSSVTAPPSDPSKSTPGKDTSSESAQKTVADSIDNADSQVQSQAVADGEAAEAEELEKNLDAELGGEQQEDVSEVVAGSTRTRSLDQEQRTTSEDNILSVGIGDKAILLDKSKVIALGQKVAAVFLGVTFAIAVYRTLKKFSSPKAKRKRTVNKNRELVEELMKFLPGNRETLTPQSIWMLRVKTGYSSTEIFRKYLWFLLRERAFDQEAVDDLVHLKNALGMGDEEVAAGLSERSQRIYDKYGSLMLNTEGLSSSGIERKATCKALFSKMLYLADYEPLLNQESEVKETVNLREIFGATESDVEKLRIISLQDIDMDKLDDMASTDKGSQISDVE